MTHADNTSDAPPASQGTAKATPRGLRWLRNGALAGVLVLAGFAAGVMVERARSAPTPLADLGPAPQYALTNQLGQPVASTRFAGKVQVVTFLFPYCTTYCPLIAAHLMGFERFLALAQGGLRDKVEIVSFNVAPGAVGPQQMREFLHQYGWNPKDPHWQFLTGSKGDIRRVVTNGYHVAFRRVAEGGSETDAGPAETPQLTVSNPLAEKAKPGYDITHNDAIEIVDPQGRIRKIYDDADVVSNEQLYRDVARLLKNG
ncbi:MAG TPA: SCO family protein [Pseudolabrys sp.]|nr:SCO family protein [Pseudolabrys sp.]